MFFLGGGGRGGGNENYCLAGNCVYPKIVLNHNCKTYTLVSSFFFFFFRKTSDFGTEVECSYFLAI